MKTLIGLALLTVAAASPGLADTPPVDAKRPRPGPAAPAVELADRPIVSVAPRRRVHAPRYRRFAPAVAVAAGPVYGREPVYYPGAGGASPNAGFGPPVPVAVVGYREAYIGRGLIYNTPPEPAWAVGWAGHSSHVISVKN